ncbi:hypothetical protein RAA17_07365 [Komagataeibacter rhaeticus]|nr:hypothetical protein [Komagataeibacter rhaeticus]
MANMIPPRRAALTMVKPDVPAPAPAADGFRVSESAARRLREILDEQPPPPMANPRCGLRWKRGMQRVPIQIRTGPQRGRR